MNYTEFEQWYNQSGIYQKYVNEWIGNQMVLDPNDLVAALHSAWEAGRSDGDNNAWWKHMEQNNHRD